MEAIGCSWQELQNHIEKQFTPNMTWKQVMSGEIHIDHIKPLALFNLENPEEFFIACHYTNLQPLWAIDNLRKGTRFEIVA